MDLDEEHIYKYVQDIFRRGLVIVVGSGASAAFELPGMADLARHLLVAVPREISARSLSCTPQWAPISDGLRGGVGLEESLAHGVNSDELADLISEQIAICIEKHEMVAITKILLDPVIPPFARIFQHVLRTSARVDVITTNYDRLLEVQAARAGISVDTMFYGHTVGIFDPGQSAASMLRASSQVGRGRSTTFRTAPHVSLSKPHGSLDWFTCDGRHLRSDLAIPGARRIVAPGANKYRQGYDVPFDQQRERANSAIDSAAALLFVGYGFNDDHLQTHIKEKIQSVPTVVLARTITTQAKGYLATNLSALGIEADPTNNEFARISQGVDEVVLPNPLWSLESLVEEVLAK